MYSVMNLLIGVNGLKFWARNQRKQREEQQSESLDVKEMLLEKS